MTRDWADRQRAGDQRAQARVPGGTRRHRSRISEGRAAALLIVEDDGAGCPSITQGGIGSRLDVLVKQIGGRIAWEAGDPGCRVPVVLEPASR